MPGKPISNGKKIAAAAMRGMGVPKRTVARELGISPTSAYLAGEDESLDVEKIKEVQERLGGRMAVASDRFLSQSLSRLKELGPYQAMLCSGIAFDKYKQGSLSAHGAGGTILVQLLTLIDQSQRSTPPDMVIDGS